MLLLWVVALVVPDPAHAGLMRKEGAAASARAGMQQIVLDASAEPEVGPEPEPDADKPVAQQSSPVIFPP